MDQAKVHLILDQYDAIAECGSEADFNADDGPGKNEDTGGDVGNGLAAEFDDFNDFDMLSLESHNRNRLLTSSYNFIIVKY